MISCCCLALAKGQCVWGVPPPPISLPPLPLQLSAHVWGTPQQLTALSCLQPWPGIREQGGVMKPRTPSARVGGQGSSLGATTFPGFIPKELCQELGAGGNPLWLPWGEPGPPHLLPPCWVLWEPFPQWVLHPNEPLARNLHWAPPPPEVPSSPIYSLPCFHHRLWHPGLAHGPGGCLAPSQCGLFSPAPGQEEAGPGGPRIPHAQREGQDLGTGPQPQE